MTKMIEIKNLMKKYGKNIVLRFKRENGDGISKF